MPEQEQDLPQKHLAPLTHGRIVEYCLDVGPNKGQYRPAIVTRAWNHLCAQLQVFVDKFNDVHDPQDMGWARSSASMGEGPGTWRWPKRD